MVARQFQQHYEDYGNRPPPSPVAEHVVPLTGRSGKGSCSAAGAPGDDMDETRPCQLYILSDTGTMLVACGTVYEISTIVHGVQLSEDEVKVTVDEVVIADVVLPVPTDEFFTVEEAFKSFVAWPRHLVGDVSNAPQIGQEGSPTPKKTHLYPLDFKVNLVKEVKNEREGIRKGIKECKKRSRNCRSAVSASAVSESRSEV
ncbi:hypothetical protein LR48_Vigan05g125100 [Vigna angularis]|uniref:DUF8039 domain-containing protein n=1 Tax=Phaseolus angularis TaxID=3914 RepID=A0A0L9ULR7_PHAAN|nr:hypothetical protein LR48_Vigan05g125100 [Vigna angularis]